MDCFLRNRFLSYKIVVLSTVSGIHECNSVVEFLGENEVGNVCSVTAWMQDK
jgi:hypothetical protein